ncbi:SlyX family protein [Kiloniella laminariae]|uniref:SlyX family protein n=1 Tax=Kiloniella laminariae TaxID=454162 RepID=A0ABT4LH39_9PROT|nr:SlyX family protein [Kiloniella laminariae]MCZ4280420.1 SlyX family protein [Kiloniella laminariae]
MSKETKVSEELVMRIDTLESHVAEQEQVIHDLSDVLAKQWQKIETLSRRLDQVQHLLDELETEPESGRKPPHY